jgi:tetratricopeptide (TPR) repeat protein
VRSAPADDEAIARSTQKSESLIRESQDAFKQKNYLVALELADKAIAESPGDGALHEYRALVLFALGKYGDAAGVLNPVLASGPGWDWSTMIALYDAQETYTDQLQKLEAYTEQKPDAADSHFLLGYHYMVCGHLDLATPQFDTAVRLMPNDSVSKELAELTRATAKPGDTEPAQTGGQAEEAPAPAPVPLEKLSGTWVSTREGGGTITLSFGNDGKFNWSFVKDGKTSQFSGEYSINDNGLLVLDSKESQMVASVDMPQETQMKFVIAGGPPADPGLSFVKN